jgi:hypothetical protein
VIVNIFISHLRSFMKLYLSSYIPGYSPIASWATPIYAKVVHALPQSIRPHLSCDERSIALSSLKARLRLFSTQEHSASCDTLKAIFEALRQQSEPFSALEAEELRLSLSLDHLNTFFDYLTKKSIKTQSTEVLNRALEVLDPAMAKHFDQVKDWVTTVASCLPPPLESSSSSQERPNPSQDSAIITQFLPNLGRIIWQVNKLFQSASPPGSLYEYGVLITLYFHLFKIPFCVTQSVKAFVPKPAYAYILSCLIQSVAISCFYTYLKWFRSCPTRIPYFEALFKDPGCHADVHQHESARVKSLIGDGQHPTRVNILLVGKPGIGKSAFINSLSQLLPGMKSFRLQNWAVFNAGAMTMSPGEKMERSVQEVQGFEEQIILCCDELGDALKNRDSASFIQFFKPVLNNPYLQFVAALTEDQYKQLQKEDKALLERFVVIEMKPTDPSSTLSILSHRMRRYASGVSACYEALNKCVELGDLTLSEHAQPRQSITTLNELINRVCSFNPEHYLTPKLQEAQVTLNNLLDRVLYEDDPLEEPGSERCQKYLQDVAQARKTLEEEEQHVKRQRKLAKRCMHALTLMRHYREERNSLTRQLASKESQEQNPLLTMRLLMINFILFKRLRDKINYLKKHLDKEIPLAIDTAQLTQLMEAKPKKQEREADQKSND